MLRDEQVEAFGRDGFVAVRGAVPPEVIRECRAEVDAALRAAGVDPDDPETWTRPVVRVPCPWTPAFAAAGTQPVLWEAYDQLLGPSTWRPVPGVGGTIPVRFPHPDDPGDAGWHVDGSFAGDDGDWWVNVRSRERGLLGLFLLTDVGDDDAPTEILAGSHLDLPRRLAPFGDEGASFRTASSLLPPSTLERPVVRATGRAGDAYVCHPFLVHRATWPHRGTRPRAIAQPGVATLAPFPLTGEGAFPVEAAILAALDDRPERPG